MDSTASSVSEVQIQTDPAPRKRKPSLHGATNRARAYAERREDLRMVAAISFVHPRTCKTCGFTKEQTEFAAYHHSGYRYRHVRCNSCRSQMYKRSPSCREKRALLERMRSKPCADCGQQFDPAAMRFWCARGRPAFPMSSAWTGRSLDSILTELVKYEIVCANHYAIRKMRKRTHKTEVGSKLAELPPELRAQVDLPPITQDDKALRLESKSDS